MTGERERGEAVNMGRYEPATWDGPGRCLCGGVLPPMQEWHDAGRDWSHTRCPDCRTRFVDEEEYIAVYGPDSPWFAEPCCRIEENQTYMERERAEAELNGSMDSGEGMR